MRTHFFVQVLAAAVLVSACNCDNRPPVMDGGAGGMAGGNAGAGGGDGAGGATGGGSGGDGGALIDPNDPRNDQRDSDCDGLSDAEEFGNTYPGGARTSPDAGSRRG